ncbi:MAG: beta-propeller domain-containing protein, partial [Allosphingosinicella sp.]
MGWRDVTIGLVLAAALIQPAAAQRRQPAPPDPAELQRTEAALAAHSSPTLRRFESEAAFQRYLQDIRAAARLRGMWWSGNRRIQFAQSSAAQTEPPLCPPENPDCVADQADESLVVTGSRVGRAGAARASSAPANPSITNTQEAGVDEGDIVKQIGQFLLILQDGRIFVVDTQARGGRRLALTDRMNVYRSRGSGAWYDEMLVQGDRVVVTAYSYEQRASEISVFRLDPRGRLSRLGVFYMSSNDYYSADNYATRLVGDSLVVYTPMWLRNVRPGTPVPWPLIRRWTEGETREAALARGTRLFDATSIYRPVRTTFEPVVHTVSVCPLTPAGSGGNLDCRTTAFIGPAQREYYVSPDSAYIWLSPGYQEMQSVRQDRSCPDGPERSANDVVPALLYRLPLSGAAPSVVGTAGTPIDQFSMAEIDGRFRALLRWPARCRESGSDSGYPR